MARLGDLCDVLNGYAFKSEQYVDSGVRIVRIANVQKGYIEDSAPVFYPIDNSEYKKYELKEEDLLLSLTGNVGRVALLQKEFLPAALNQRVACLRIKDETILCKSFLFNFLNSDYFENKCIESSKGVAQKNMSTEWLKEYDIPLFSIDKQEEISNELDTISSLVSLRKQQLSKLDELFKSRFIELFGDPKSNPKGYTKKQLGETCKVITGNTPSRAVAEYYGDHIEWIKTDNIVSGLLNPTTATECLSEKGMTVSRTVESGAILMACIAGSVSSIGRVCVTNRKVAFNQQINAIVPYDYNILFLYAMLQIAKEYLVDGINMALKGILSKSKLEEKTFFVPPIELQEQFAAFVEQTDKSKFEIQKSLEKLEILKKSLMQQYFG